MSKTGWKSILAGNWMLTIYVLVILMVLWVVTGMDVSKSASEIYNHLVVPPQLKADVAFRMTIFDMAPYGMAAHVTNLNNFTWTDVRVYANGTTLCHLQPDVHVLLPGDGVDVACADADGRPLKIYSSLVIKTAENQNGYYAKIG